MSPLFVITGLFCFTWFLLSVQTVPMLDLFVSG